jgi:hypothetical protein
MGLRALLGSTKKNKNSYPEASPAAIWIADGLFPLNTFALR